MSTVAVVQGQSGTITVTNSNVTATATCTGNRLIVGGGYSGDNALVVSTARITTEGRGGVFTVTANDGAFIGTTSFTVFAYCAP